LFLLAEKLKLVSFGPENLNVLYAQRRGSAFEH
jgi:hypothetical protein